MSHKVNEIRDEGETRDVPFLKNDMKDHLATTGKPLEPADGPGKADAELFDEHLVSRAVNPG